MNRKKAFSLMELLLIIVVLGIIASLFIKMVRVDTITTKYTTYAAWQNIYNIIDELQNDERADGDKVSAVVNNDDGAFCKASAKLVSTIDQTVNCDVSNVPSAPNYTFSNGMQIFGLQQNADDITLVNTANGNPQGHYRTVFIDLNGASDPDAVDESLITTGADVKNFIGNVDNMITVTDGGEGAKNKRTDLPDIIAFRIYNDYAQRHHASVVPIGIAANDRRYLTARVKITNTNTGEVKFDKNAYTYHDAECAAFGANRSGATSAQANNNPSGGNDHLNSYYGAVDCAGRLTECKQDGITCELIVVRPAGAF